MLATSGSTGATDGDDAVVLESVRDALASYPKLHETAMPQWSDFMIELCAKKAKAAE